MNSDWKNPRSQQTPVVLVGVHPWCPAGSLIWGGVRTFLQLTLVGYALTYIFARNDPWVILWTVLSCCSVLLSVGSACGLG